MATITKRTTEAERLFGLDARLHEIGRQVHQEYGYPYEANLARFALQGIAEGDFRSPLINGLFVRPEIQIENIRIFAKNNRGTGFLSNALEKLPEPPEWPEGKLSAVVLTVYWETPARTIQSYGKMISDLYQVVDLSFFKGWLDTERGSVSDLLGNRKHSPCLRWEVVDLGAHIGYVPKSLGMALQPNAAVLACAFHFPRWIQAMGENGVPNVWIPGYCVPDPSLQGHDLDRWEWNHRMYIQVEHFTIGENGRATREAACGPIIKAPLIDAWKETSETATFAVPKYILHP